MIGATANIRDRNCHNTINVGMDVFLALFDTTRVLDDGKGTIDAPNDLSLGSS
jgi:hypothetical protein